jgi:hypothetical protein
MKKQLISPLLLLLALSACQAPETATPNAVLTDELLGYWRFAYHGPENQQTYARVSGEAGLSEQEKSQMLRFFPPDRFGEFFWNWCATPPAMPSQWMEGTWQRRPGNQDVLDIEMDNFGFSYRIERLDADSLSLQREF